MSGQELYTEMEALRKQLSASIKELRKNGTDLAQKERDYKVLLRQEILKLRDEGMAVGIIDKICYGIPLVADKRFERDVAQTVYEANKEAINSLKLQIRIVQNVIDKEYSNGS
jgi:methionine synthase II (cobalamin-independent)